jgi:hypothetical protein
MKRAHKKRGEGNKFRVLALDSAGNPRKWLDPKTAIGYYASGKVAWEYGTSSYTMVGGTQASTGLLSTITTRGIVAIKGHPGFSTRGSNRPPPVTKSLLFARDQYTCAYCCNKFRANQLEQEHIVPDSRNGSRSWANLVTSCISCNNFKKNRTPTEAGMVLNYQPYVPSFPESLLLSNQHIMPDQYELLITKAKNFITYPRPVPLNEH